MRKRVQQYVTREIYRGPFCLLTSPLMDDPSCVPLASSYGNNIVVANKPTHPTASGWYMTAKLVGEGVSELRISVGPGYRVYFKKKERRLIVLLAGGDKRTQSLDYVRWNPLKLEVCSPRFSVSPRFFSRIRCLDPTLKGFAKRLLKGL
jgi:putative addiction module killer protein